MEQQQKLKTEQTLSHFFKQIPKDKKNITIHQLLTHTAGFVDGVGQNDFDMIPVYQYFKELFDTRLIYKPGSKHKYSNAGYSILARIIEIVSGQSYEAYLNQYLFNPAGMKYTGYLLPNWQDMIVAHGYSYNVLDTGSMVERYKSDGQISRVLLGNGGINSTQNDMFLWYQALQLEKIIPQKLIKKLTTPYVLEFEGDTSYYAYGWAIFESVGNTKMIAHDGSNGTFYYDFKWFPKEEILILYANNSSTPQTREIAWQISKLLFEPTYEFKPITVDPITNILRFTENYKGDFDDMTANVEALFQGETDKYLYLYRISDLYLRNGEYQKSEVLTRLNLEWFPNDDNLWELLGDIHHNQKKLKQALMAYQKAFEINPDNNYVKRMIATLKNKSQ